MKIPNHIVCENLLRQEVKTDDKIEELTRKLALNTTTEQDKIDIQKNIDALKKELEEIKGNALYPRIFDNLKHKSRVSNMRRPAYAVRAIRVITASQAQEFLREYRLQRENNI
jgi:predicted metal-dependent phosphoesterase TrpH